MPSVSEAQRRLMEMAATAKGRKKIRGKKPPLAVAKEFRAADRAKARKAKGKQR